MKKRKLIRFSRHWLGLTNSGKHHLGSAAGTLKKAAPLAGFFSPERAV